MLTNNAKDIKVRTNAPYLSVVIPIFNEADNIRELLSRLKNVLTDIGCSHEIIFIDDGSTDRSLEILKQNQKEMPGITIIEFNRNYGQHAAVFAGFERSSGEIVVTLDADLQNPPEEIPKLVKKAEEGFEVVATVRRKRIDSIFRRCASYTINRIAAKITGVNLRDYGCMLRAYRKNIVKLMCASREISTFIPVLAIFYAKNIAEIQVEHSPRNEGKSKYGIMRLISLQFDLMTSFSVWPLRMLMFLGLAASLSGVGFGAYIISMRIVMGSEWAVGGVFTLIAVLFFFVGAQFLAFGLLGEYIGRIYSEVRRRPRFVIENIYSREGGTYY